MVTRIDTGIIYRDGKIDSWRGEDRERLRKNTIAYRILKAHNSAPDDKRLKITFDALASHDITYVGIIQTSRASGLKEFPLPYVLTNCHNSLCAVGGTINEDDHMFGLSAAKKYGGIYVPAHMAVIHQYMREAMAGCGKMILGSDSHTRYGVLGTLAIGEGGGELSKQLLGKTYDIAMPEVICVHLKGKPKRGVGPQDVALAVIGEVFKNGFVKNKIMEFRGEGIAELSVDFRMGIDVMTTETTCLSSIWETDEKVRNYFELHGRPEAYQKLDTPPEVYYDGAVVVDLSKVKPMIAMPFHPSNTYTIEEFKSNTAEILEYTEQEAIRALENKSITLALADKLRDGKFHVDQGVIAGCAGGSFENLCEAAAILDLAPGGIGSDAFALSLYPASQPIYLELMRNGVAARLASTGATLRTAFCGPCFGAGDVPSNQAFSIRHSTRNFPNREGSKPSAGQISSVALMDARSIAATAAMGGVLTAADELDYDNSLPEYHFDGSLYQKRVYQGFGKAQKELPLVFGPNITDWPQMSELPDDLLLTFASVITDSVTTTDELIPSGETSSYRSNPLKLAEFTLSRKDPAYVGRAKQAYRAEEARLQGRPEMDEALLHRLRAIKPDFRAEACGRGSVLFANKPGDGSAREQAASCQKVLGTWANVALEYATKRYRSNLINWGMLPFLTAENKFETGDLLYLPDIRTAVDSEAAAIPGYLIKKDRTEEISLSLGDLTRDERNIILKGCLINYYR